jgi:hypothetical protein
MLDVREQRSRIDRIRAEAERGYRYVPMEIVMADLVEPFRRLLDEMETKARAFRWLTLDEVLRATGRSRNYFEKKLKQFDNRSRLDVWRDDGHAVLASPGIWLLNPTIVLSGPHDQDAEALRLEAPHAHDAQQHHNPDEIADQLLME